MRRRTRPLKCIALRDEIPGTITYFVSTNADDMVTHHWEISERAAHVR